MWFNWYLNITVSNVSVIPIYLIWTFHCCLCLSRRSKTHYWFIKVRIKAESWTECIYNIYTSDTGAAVNICCTARHWISTGYLLDIPRTRCFQKISLWWPFCSTRNVTSFKRSEGNKFYQVRPGWTKTIQMWTRSIPLHWQQAVYLNIENIDVACCMFCRKLHDYPR